MWGLLRFIRVIRSYCCVVVGARSGTPCDSKGQVGAAEAPRVA